MKTAMMSWCLFSIALALPVSQSPSALGKLEIEQGSHSSVENHDNNEKNSCSSDMSYDTKEEKDAKIYPSQKVLEVRAITPVQEALGAQVTKMELNLVSTTTNDDILEQQISAESDVPDGFVSPIAYPYGSKAEVQLEAHDPEIAISTELLDTA